ncbi:MAG: signal peptidase I [Candidatus Roizmanbacteria bacterium]
MNMLKGLLNFIMEILETITFVGSLFIVLYLFIAQPHQVNGRSMDNTFHNGDYILTSKISYRFKNPGIGDIIVFKSPQNPDIDFIKRVIGLPGDKIRIQEGKVYDNNLSLNEFYINPESDTSGGAFLAEGQEVTVPEGHLFVMGDNRSHSSDSREFGFIPQQDIIGQVVFRYFPPPKIGPIKNPYHKK